MSSFLLLIQSHLPLGDGEDNWSGNGVAKALLR